MFRKFRIGNNQVTNVAIIALFVAVFCSVFFGLILSVSTWYAYTFRCMIFIPLGYLMGSESIDENTSIKEKIAVLIFGFFFFALLFLFFFGLVFPVNDLWLMTLSSAIPFTISMAISTKWKSKKSDSKKDHKYEECPYEIEAPESKEKPDK